MSKPSLGILVARRLIQSQKTLAVAESCTGGLLCHHLTNIPGSSKFFKLGIISYAYEAKTKILHIPSPTLHHHGAVSKKVVTLMAQKVRRILPTDYGIGISGIAGPSGATSTKPIGLVYIAISTPQQTECFRHVFSGNRLRIKEQATLCALQHLQKLLL